MTIWHDFLLDNGIIVQYRNIPQDVLRQVQASVPDPEPPHELVDVGGEQVRVANPSHPDHAAALAAAFNQRTERVFQFCLSYGVRVPDGVTMQADIDELHAALRAVGVSPPEVQDVQLYWLQYVAAMAETLAKLSMLIFTRSEITQEAMQQHRAAFPGDVSQSEHLG